MATKRSPPKDIDTPSIQLKEPRLDTTPQTPLFGTKRVLPQSNKDSSVPTTEISSSIPFLPFVSTVSTPSTQVIGVTTGIIPNSASAQCSGKTSFEFHSSPASSSSSDLVFPVAATQKTPRMTNASLQSPTVTPLSVVPISTEQQRSSLHPQFMHGRTTRPSLVSSDVAIIAGNRPLMPLNSRTIVTSSPPPYYTSVATPNGTVSGQITCTSKLHVHVPLGMESSSELSCSSPSQFLHPPTSVFVATSAQLCGSMPSAVVTSSSVTENKQPFCCFERKVSLSGKDYLDVDQKVMKLKVLKYHRAKLASLKLKHEVDLKEKFFLESGGNMMDIVTWKKRPNSKRDKYLKLYDIDTETSSYEQVLLSDFHNQWNPSSQPMSDKIKLERPTALKSEAVVLNKNDSKHTKLQKVSTPKSEKTEEASITSTTVQIPLSTVSPGLRGGTCPAKVPQFPTSPRHVTRLQSSFSSIYETSHEDIVMRARHEAEVMRAIAELRKEGLWSASRLPKVQEPQRRKTHWDYLLEEMQWLATDFGNERRWKINAAKKVHYSTTHYMYMYS